MAKMIPLSQGKHAIVDDEDFEFLSQFKWYAKHGKQTYYATRHKVDESGKDETIRMHRVIAQASNGEIVDHINGNGLDNRKENLRIVTATQNAMNRRRRRDSRSKYKGVVRNGRYWGSRIKVNGKYVQKYANNEIEAAKQYDQMAREFYGDFASVNFTESDS